MPLERRGLLTAVIKAGIAFAEPFFKVKDMVTLRTYSNPAQAAMAKSLLDDHEIVCSLADENSNLYGGGPMVMPIRLLVAEEQAEQRRTSWMMPGSLSQDDFDTGGDSPETAKETPPEITPEMARLWNTLQWIAGMVAALLVLTIYLITELPRRAVSPWTSVKSGDAAV